MTKNTRSKVHNIFYSLPNIRKKRNYISATKLSNYMMNNPLIDWLKKYHSHSADNSSSSNMIKMNPFTHYITQQGIEFEKKMIKYINDNIHPIISVSEYITKDSIEKVKKLIKQKVPIIHSAPLKNKYNSTQGVADLLVRSDYLYKFYEDIELEKEDELYYVIIDIKFSTLPLRSDGIHLLNKDRYPAYKSQLWIYNQALGYIQNYTPRYSYILGRRWTYTSCGEKHWSPNCLGKLGVIDYEDIDNHIIHKSKDALKWLRDVDNKGKEWSVYPPSRPELYPNMKVDSYEWSDVVEDIADKCGEITKIWYVGKKNRDISFENGIKSWRDPKCSAENMGITGARKNIINNIIKVNQQSQELFRPAMITSNLFEWRKQEPKEIYLDFETMFDIILEDEVFPNHPKREQIFMIGVGWEENGVWKYKDFTCKKLTFENEKEIINDFVKWYKNMGSPRIWYWHAEEMFWNRAMSRQRCHIELKLCDLSKLFREEPIVIKDCFNYGLKHVSECMRKHSFINTKIESDTENGRDACINALKAYRENKMHILKDISIYNEFDCKVMRDILKYLRENR